MKRFLSISILLVSAFCFSRFVRFEKDKPVFIPPSKQRSGNAATGYQYLTTGDYVKSGIPYELFVLGMGKNQKRYLDRQGLNANVPYDYTVVKASNGENLVAPNCMQCHAQVMDSTVVIGLGNTFIDFSNTQRLNTQSLVFMENMLKNSAPKKYEAAKPFLDVTKTIGPLLTTRVRGVNAAGRLAAVLAAHRDPSTFKWTEKASIEIPTEVIPSDVPAWWLLKKKNAMFYTGFGRGDFGKFLMASNLLTVNDTSESVEVDRHISDVLAYLKSLEPPKYPLAIEPGLASKGKILFEKSCSKCHGKYGEKEEYPNYLIPASVIKTDSLLYKSNYQNPQFITWFNNSWFAKGDHAARLEPFEGYIAPPLDGVWVTAPYLHNGSVPTIEAVLNSKVRPRYWSRDFNVPKYDYEKLGWQYEAHDQPAGTSVYNTDLPGYGNYGHNFGDKLSEEDRKAVIEYLKTL